MTEHASDDAGADGGLEVVVLHVGPYRMDRAAMSDVADLLEAFADPAIALWNPPAVGAGTPEERAPQWVVGRSRWDGTHASWVVRDVDGRLIGQVSLHNLDHDAKVAEVGYWFTPRGRGRGIGTATLDAATRYAFDELGMVRVQLFHAAENAPSCRMALRAGFLHEGTTRSSYVYGDGLRHDEHLHGRLVTDPAPDIRPPD